MEWFYQFRSPSEVPCLSQDSNPGFLGRKDEVSCLREEPRSLLTVLSLLEMSCIEAAMMTAALVS